MDIYSKLQQIKVEELKKSYQNANPFPFVYIDDFFPLNFANDLEIQCRDAFVDKNNSDGFQQKNKFSLNNWELMPSLMREACTFFNSGNFLSDGLEKCFSEMVIMVNEHLNQFTLQNILEIEKPKDLIAFEI